MFRTASFPLLYSTVSWQSSSSTCSHPTKRERELYPSNQKLSIEMNLTYPLPDLRTSPFRVKRWPWAMRASWCRPVDSGESSTQIPWVLNFNSRNKLKSQKCWRWIGFNNGLDLNISITHGLVILFQIVRWSVENVDFWILSEFASCSSISMKRNCISQPCTYSINYAQRVKIHYRSV